MQEPERMRLIFVKYLSNTTTREMLQEYFEKFGKVVEIKSSMLDPTSLKSRDFGFVVMGSSAEVDNVMAEKSSHIIDGRKVQVKRALTKELMSECDVNLETCRLFVGGMSGNTTKEEMQTYFSQFGNFKEVVLVTDKVTNQSRQFGFVQFDRPDLVEKVLLHGEHTLQGKKLTVKKAIDRTAVTAKSLRCSCGGKLYWGGPNMGINGRELRGMGDFCVCGEYKQQDPGAGWAPNAQNFMYGAVQRRPGAPEALLPTPNAPTKPSGGKRTQPNLYQVPPPAPYFPEMQFVHSLPPPYTPVATAGYQEQIRNFNNLNYQYKVNKFLRYKKSQFYDYDYEVELFKQAFPTGATMSQRDEFFNFGIGRPGYACGLHFEM